MQITEIVVRVIAPPVTRHGWAHDLTDQYMTATLVTIQTDEGLEGTGCATTFTAHDFDRSIAETLRTMIPALIGTDLLPVETHWQTLRPRTLPRAYGAQSAVDMALWDLRGKQANLPVYKLLGGGRTRVPAYASTTLLPDVVAYLKCIESLIDQGFRAIKFHAWGIPERDLELCRAARKTFPDMAFMLDAEGNYERENALRAASELEQLNFTWLEAPLSDYDVAGYRELVRQSKIKIIPAGNWIVEPALIQEMIDTRTWSAVRIDAGTCGGITVGHKALVLAEAAGLSGEVQCWAYTLQQAADLHLIAAHLHCTYFEQPVPYEAFEYGITTPIRTQRDGYVDVPEKPGLGIDIDWDAVQAATIHTITSRH